MSVPVDRAGTFRANIVEYGLKEMESGSVAIALKAQLTEWWDPAAQAWVDWAPYGMEATGDLWVVKKDGNPNDKSAESLMRHAGWDASFSSVVNGTWQPTPCQVDIKEEEYQQKKTLRLSFLADFNRTPGALSNVDPAKASALDTRFGGTFRALAANVMRNRPAATTNSRPSAPPPPVAAAATGEGIPF